MNCCSPYMQLLSINKASTDQKTLTWKRICAMSKAFSSYIRLSPFPEKQYVLRPVSSNTASRTSDMVAETQLQNGPRPLPFRMPLPPFSLLFRLG